MRFYDDFTLNCMVDDKITFSINDFKALLLLDQRRSGNWKKKGSYNISLLQKLHSAFICTYELDFFVVPSYKYSKSIDTYRDSWGSSSNYISNIKQI